MKIIKTPNPEFTGSRAGVKFVNGVGETDDSAALVSFRRHGYSIEDPETEDEQEGEQGGDANPLADLKLDELKAYADEHGIDLGDATKKDDIKAAIEAATSQPDA